MTTLTSSTRSTPWTFLLFPFALVLVAVGLMAANVRFTHAHEVAEAACASIGSKATTDRSPISCVAPDGVLRVVPEVAPSH